MTPKQPWLNPVVIYGDGRTKEEIEAEIFDLGQRAIEQRQGSTQKREGQSYCTSHKHHKFIFSSKSSNLERDY